MAYIYEDMTFEKEEGIATVTLNRPERLNALSIPLREGLIKAVEDVACDDATKVLIITGAGRGFCAGADVKGTLSGLEPGALPWVPGREGRKGPTSQVMLMLQNLEKPVIAAVNGVAAGAGFGLALGCDIRIASENARFISVFIRRGLAAEWGVTYYLPRIVGISKALEIMWTGDEISATEAERLGIVSKIVPHDELMKVAKEFASRLARGPSLSIELIKRMVYSGLRANDLVSQMAHEQYVARTVEVTEDFKEGVKAFLEKREAVFKGM